jgi:hypothetical protein
VFVVHLVVDVKLQLPAISEPVIGKKSLKIPKG